MEAADYSQCVQQISDKLAWLGKLGSSDSDGFVGIVRTRGAHDFG
jgi:hypothetical protein